jgi:hypothetical protein
MSQFRDVLREMLCPIMGDVPAMEEMVINITSAARLAFSTEDPQPRQGTMSAMLHGLNRIQTIKAQMFDRFRVNYSWETKQGEDMLEFFVNRPEGETIDKFANWYWSDKWRRESKGAPSLKEIYELWPQAFGTPRYLSEDAQPQIFHAGDK